MAKEKTVYTCSECGGTSPKWLGKCPSCEAWNTLVESVAEAAGPKHRYQALAGALPVATLADIEASDVDRQPTGIDELDRVLGGGIVAGVAFLFLNAGPTHYWVPITFGSAAASACFALGFLPQLLLMVHSKSSGGFSLGLSLLDLSGCSFSVVVLVLASSSSSSSSSSRITAMMPYLIIIFFQVGRGNI